MPYVCYSTFICCTPSSRARQASSSHAHRASYAPKPTQQLPSSSFTKQHHTAPHHRAFRVAHQRLPSIASSIQFYRALANAKTFSASVPQSRSQSRARGSHPPAHHNNNNIITASTSRQQVRSSRVDHTTPRYTIYGVYYTFDLRAVVQSSTAIGSKQQRVAVPITFTASSSTSTSATCISRHYATVLRLEIHLIQIDQSVWYNLNSVSVDSSTVINAKAICTTFTQTHIHYSLDYVCFALRVYAKASNYTHVYMIWGRQILRSHLALCPQCPRIQIK